MEGQRRELSSILGMGVYHRRFLPSEGRVLYLQDTESKANARPRTETFVYHAKTPSLVPGDGNPWMGLMQRGGFVDTVGKHHPLGRPEAMSIEHFEQT